MPNQKRISSPTVFVLLAIVFAGAVTGSTVNGLSCDSQSSRSTGSFGLNPEQQALWEEIEQARENSLLWARELLAATEQALDAELRKPEPDLAGLGVTTEAAVDELLLELRANRDRQLALFAELDPEQREAVGATMRERLARLRWWLDLLAFG